MATDGVAELPDELERWVEERADELGDDSEAVLERAVTAYRLVADDGDVDADAVATEARVEELAEQVESLDGRLDEQVQDLRERVVEVLKTAEAKASADHDHPELADVDDVDERIQTLAADVDELDETLADLSDHLDGGFENYESILRSLRQRTDALADRTDSLAAATSELQTTVRDLKADAARRAAVEELQRAANREGVREADCASCGAALHVGQLTAPQCPHCETTFGGVEPGRGFFSNATLTAGDRPALTGSTVDEESGDVAEATEATDGGDPTRPAEGDQ